MTKKYNELNEKLQGIYAEMGGLIKDYQKVCKSYKKFLLEKQAEYEMAGEAPFDDEDFEVAADEEEALSGAVDELKDVFHSLEDVLEEFTEISLDYAD